MKSFYKPRYKICFQSKNKVYLNKNSKFRRYFNVRDPIFIRRYFNYRKTLILRNMKWTVTRRFMNPVLRKRNFSRYQYGSLLINKQQLKHFYGNLKEKQFKKLFTVNFLKNKQYKEEAFLGALEHRLDILLFRMRILPTIFSCKQYILHQGIYVNNQLITLPNYKVKIGDIVSIKSEHWPLFYNRIQKKASIRYIGHELNRSNINHKNKEYTGILRESIRKYKKFNLRILEEFNRIKKNNTKLESLFIKEIMYNKNISNDFKFKILLVLKFFKKKFKNLTKIKPHLRLWKSKHYFNGELYLITNIILLKFYYKNYKVFLNYVLNNISKKNTLKSQSQNYLTSLNNLEKYLLCSFRNYFLIPAIIEKKFLKKIRKSRLHKQRRKANVWWLNKDFEKERIQRHQWWWESTPHWYIPNYLEIDYKTLRIGIVSNPKTNEVFYPFHISFNQLISFYTDKGY